MPALVFGAGYLGAALIARLLRAGEDVVAVENGFATDWPAVEQVIAAYPTRGRLLRGDVRRGEDVDAAYTAARASGDVSAVYLLAAQASAHPDAALAEYTEETNLRGPRLVYEAAARHGAPPVVYGSSFHVYGSGLTGEVDEHHPYGTLRDLSHLSKVYAEKLGEMYAVTRGLPVAPVRLGIVYGIGPIVKQDFRFVTAPHAFCLRALAGQPLTIHAGVATPLGFIHLDDAVEALLAASRVEAYAPANAVGEVTSVAAVARLVRRTAAAHGIEVAIQPADPPSPHAQRAQDDSQTAIAVRSRLEALGWRPARDLASTVPEIFAYYARRGGHTQGARPT